jgi:hypothetical protein
LGGNESKTNETDIIPGVCTSGGSISPILEHVRRLLHARLALEWLLGRDPVVPQVLQLALVLLVIDFLVLLDDLLHRDLASGGDVVWRADVHDPVSVSQVPHTRVSSLCWTPGCHDTLKALSYARVS